jgi:hypothetical protein
MQVKVRCILQMVRKTDNIRPEDRVDTVFSSLTAPAAALTLEGCDFSAIRTPASMDLNDMLRKNTSCSLLTGVVDQMLQQLVGKLIYA